MICISNTSPINYLILIDQIELLPSLYGEVILPQAVVTELQAPKTPENVRRLIASHPAWMRTEHAIGTDASLMGLGAGEAEVIALAQLLTADLLLIDELDGRQAATRRGLNVTGTLGILKFAAKRGLIDLSDATGRLAGTSFRVSPALLESLSD